MKVFSIFALILILGVLRVSAQTSGQTIDSSLLSDLKLKISDLFNTITQLIEKISNSLKITGIFRYLWNLSIKIFIFLKNIFGIVNSWLEKNLGVNIAKIITWIGNAFIWILELVIKLLKALMNLVT